MTYFVAVSATFAVLFDGCIATVMMLCDGCRLCCFSAVVTCCSMGFCLLAVCATCWCVLLTCIADFFGCLLLSDFLWCSWLVLFGCCLLLAIVWSACCLLIYFLCSLLASLCNYYSLFYIALDIC